jgi:DUF1680 family protein
LKAKVAQQNKKENEKQKLVFFKEKTKKRNLTSTFIFFTMYMITGADQLHNKLRIREPRAMEMKT